MGNCISDSNLVIDDDEKKSTSFFRDNNSIFSGNDSTIHKDSFFNINNKRNNRIPSTWYKKPKISVSLENENLEAKCVKSQSSLINSLWGSDFSSPIEHKLRTGNFKVLDVG